VFKVICGLYNHDLTKTFGHPYVDILRPDEHALVVDMTKSQLKPSNILFTLKENNENNVKIIKQFYNVRYTYKRSLKGSRIELQKLMMLLERDHYIHWSMCHQYSEVMSDIFWTHSNLVKLLNASSIVFLMDMGFEET